MDRNVSEHLLGEAAQWCARLAASDCSAAERAEFELWLACDASHRAALEQVQRAEARIDGALTADLRLKRLADQAFSMGTASTVSSNRRVASLAQRDGHRRAAGRWSHGFSVAAAAAVICILAVAWRVSDVSRSESRLPQLVLESPAHSTLQSTLADGSVVHLDAGSRLQVKVSSTERELELLSGRAYFEVAHDATRPFAVTANGTRTVALGTKFEVRRDEAGAVVTLAEGSVAVSDTHGKWKTRLQPGEQLDIAVASAETKLNKVDPKEVTSWSRGWLEFRGTPLADALSDINRYSAKRVVVADESLLQLRVAGSFIAGDTQSIVDAIAEVLPIRAVDGNHEIILFKRYEK